MLCFYVFMKFMYMDYVLDFSLLGIRLTPFCLYVQENSLSGGKGSWKLGECVLRRNGFKSRAFRFEDVVLFLWFLHVFFRTCYVIPFYFKLCYVLFLKQWDPIS